MFKEVNQKRYPPTEIVAKVVAAGYTKFKIQDHTTLWQKLDAKGVGNEGFGAPGDYKGTWVWYDKWLEKVIAFCDAEGNRFR